MLTWRKNKTFVKGWVCAQIRCCVHPLNDVLINLYLCLPCFTMTSADHSAVTVLFVSETPVQTVLYASYQSIFLAFYSWLIYFLLIDFNKFLPFLTKLNIFYRRSFINFLGTIFVLFKFDPGVYTVKIQLLLESELFLHIRV